MIDQNHNDLGKVLTLEHMNRLAERVKRNIGQNIIRHARKQINELIEYATTLAENEKEKIIIEATNEMQEKQNKELQRLQSLSKVNPNIRIEEIEYLRDTIQQTDEIMRQAQLKLDAIRVVVSRR